MAKCQNCGEHVSDQYARVFTPNVVDQPRVCPNCPDLVRDNGRIREARASRNGGNPPTKYDPRKNPADSPDDGGDDGDTDADG